MRRIIHFVAPIAPIFGAAALAAAVLASGAEAATYRGRTVDGEWFTGSAFNVYAGLHDDVRIKFSGETAYVRLGSGAQLVLSLEEEAIANPREIEAEEHRRGLHWVLCLKNLGAK